MTKENQILEITYRNLHKHLLTCSSELPTQNLSIKYINFAKNLVLNLHNRLDNGAKGHICQTIIQKQRALTGL